MKKLLFVFVAMVIIVMCNAPVTTAAEYVVIKNGEKITITEVTVNSSGSHTWVSTFDFINPTISQLSGIGLPTYYWSWVSGPDGAYDTRLVKAGQELEEIKSNYEAEKDNVSYLENKINGYKIWLTLFAIGLVSSFIGLITKQNKIKNLRSC